MAIQTKIGLVTWMTTSNIFLTTGGPISWLSKKQAAVALSTSEAEYVALSSVTQEAVWLRKLLISDLQVTSGIPIALFEIHNFLNLLVSLVFSCQLLDIMAILLPLCLLSAICMCLKFAL